MWPRLLMTRRSDSQMTGDAAGMSEIRYDLGPVTRIDPDAVGQPGQRRFRLVIDGSGGSACLWLEKEQLQALGLAIDQLLAPLATLWTRNPADPSAETTPTGGAGAEPASIELQVGRLALGHDPEVKEFLLLVHEIEADPDGPATLVCRANRGQLRELSQKITSLAAAGRPRCPLCGQPIGDEPHTCPGSNGHGVRH